MTESMLYTRCPACQTVYELDARLLAAAAGVVRCGNCGKTFNSLSELYDHRPQEPSRPLSASGMPPLMEHADLVQGELPVDVVEYDDDLPEADILSENTDDDPPGPGRIERAKHLLWPALSGLLVLALLIQIGISWHRTGSLPGGFFSLSPKLDTRIDLNEAIEIVSRDLHTHPSIDDGVILSVSLRNRAERAIPYPALEVRFYDASQQVLGARRLYPHEYLRDDDLIDEGMSPGVLMPMLLEFIMDGGEPTGFHMRFLPAAEG
ncbi:MAG TPA: zinc-ribbon and DUF3426 domain-containing protein [Wenzhouxiangella sp.]|nr:zinc-ribbon and DUF3426 domain-containing protein [Wenzhouxiangella sp.]